jgi:hypothetical protein
MSRYITQRLGHGDELWDFPPNYPTFGRIKALLQRQGMKLQNAGHGWLTSSTERSSSTGLCPEA